MTPEKRTPKPQKPKLKPPEIVEPDIEIFATLDDISRKLTNLIKIVGYVLEKRHGKFYDNYYNTPLTAIQVATPNPPDSSPLDPYQTANATTGQTGYQVEGVFTQLKRTAPKITVINDGTSDLFVIATSDNKKWSREVRILVGEAFPLFNVWELRLRSPTAGNLTAMTGGIYRVTEYDPSLAYSSEINAATFDARVVNAPVAGALLSTQLGGTIRVPNGYALALRANILNAGQVYIAVNDPAIPNSGINRATGAIAGRRITLSAGDTAKLFIKNTDPVAIAGSAVGQNLDVLVEQ